MNEVKHHVDLIVSEDIVRIGVYSTQRRVCRCIDYQTGKTLEEALRKLQEHARDLVKQLINL